MASENADIPMARGAAGFFRWAPVVIGLLGAFACALGVSADHFTGKSETGWKEYVAFASGGGLIALATILHYSPAEVWRRMAILLQLALLYWVIKSYELETGVFHDFLFGLVVCGAVANGFLPQAWRPLFFLGLSMFALLAVLGAVNAGVVVVLGAGMIGLCHLPVPIWLRAGLVMLAALPLAAVRAGWISADWLAAVLPVFGSIFMFRLAIYLYDLSSGSGPKDWPTRLSYFLMLPNVVFPFYPVVDFSAWGRSRTAGQDLEVLQRGVVWVLIGALHLLLYRFVNYYAAMDPTEVRGFADFVWYAVTNFALYLKISGLFHTILGCLYLFGFALPETHTRYYLSFSFVEFWRRINIYWKDFMQKMVFNPTYMALKRRRVGHQSAVVLSILAVFFLTWVLHAYQWFWLRGTLLLTVPDVLFWLVLAVFLVIQTMHEAKPAKTGARAMIGPAPLLALRTVATMFIIVVLWSMWSSETMAEWSALLAAAGLPLLDPSAPWTGANLLSSVGFVALLFVTTALALGFTFGLAPKGSHPRPRLLGGAEPGYAFWRHGALAVGVGGLLLVAQTPAVYMMFPRQAQLFAVDMAAARLSSRDQTKLERGYYEHLTNVKFINSELWNVENSRVPDWPLLEETAAVDLRDDYLAFVLRPSVAIPHKGAVLSTNALGMRDREYTVAKPEGVRRIVVIGASRAMGEGVNDDEVFEALIENSLNAASGPPVESLNLAVAGYDAFQKEMVLEQRAGALAPDVVLNVSHNNDYDLGRRLARYVGTDAIPYDYLKTAIAESGATADMDRTEVERRLQPYASQVVGESYRRFVRQTRAMGAVPVWIFLPSTKAYPEPLPEATELKRLAAEAGFVVIDLHDIYNDVPVEPLWVANWDQHPNAMGHRLIAERLEAELMRLDEVRKALGRD